MDDLKVLYFNIENPIDNKLKWQKILNTYSISSNFKDFYSKITDREHDSKIYYDEDGKKNFYLMMWSIWKRKILSIKEEKLMELVSSKEFDSDIYEVIKIVRDLDSIKTFIALRNVLADPGINRYFSFFFDDFNHDVVICSEFGMRKDPKYNTVFTITVDAINLYKLLKNFVNECIDQAIPYYFKYKEEGKNVEVTIYSSYEYVKRIDSLLDILKKENYTFFKKNRDNILSGNINEWVSIRNKDFYNNYDYQVNRATILFRSIDSVMYDYILNHCNILVSYKDGRMNLLEYLSTYVMEKVVNKLLSTNIRTNSEYFYIANSKDLLDLKDYIKSKLSLNMREILNERLYLNSDSDTVKLQLNQNKTIEIDNEIFMCAIRNLTSTLLLKDNGLEKLFRVRIKNECNFYKVDPDKFCLDASITKKIFFNVKKYDAYQNKLDKIHLEVEKFDNLERLMNSEKTDETREEIATSMNELLAMFED